VSQAVIVLAVCAGVSLGVLQPLKNRLSAERAQLAAGQSLVVQNQAMQVKPNDPQLAARNKRLYAHLRGLATTSDSAASLHNTLMTLARETGVVIEAVEPRQLAVPPPAPPAVAIPGAMTPTASPVAPSSAFSAGITGQGTYEAIAAFLGRLEEAGLARLVSGQVTPQHSAGGEPAARFALTTVHFGFSVPTTHARAAATGGGP